MAVRHTPLVCGLDDSTSLEYSDECIVRVIGQLAQRSEMIDFETRGYRIQQLPVGVTRTEQP